MKTNASIKSIVAAVEKVSKEKYDGNLILAKKPDELTKYVNRFTLRTRDKTKAGSLINKDQKPLPRANWEAHMAVINEIFTIEAKDNIYVETLYGRQFSDESHLKLTASLTPVAKEGETTTVEAKETPKKEKRPYRKSVVRNGNQPVTGEDRISINGLISALQQVLHKEQQRV